MAIPVMNYQPESFAQANPFLTGMQVGQGLVGGGIQNAYLAPQLAAQLRSSQLQNQILAPQAQYAPQLTQADLQRSLLGNQILGAQAQYAQPMELAKLQAAQMQPGLLGAETGLAGAEGQRALAGAGLTNEQAQLLSQTMPYQVQQAQEAVYTDPILSRLKQLQMAQQTGAIPNSLLQQTGLIPSGGAYSPSTYGTSGGVSQQFPGIGGGMPSVAGTPKLFGGNGMENWALFGSPLSPLTMMQLGAYGKGLDTQSTTGVSNYNSWQDEANKASDTANSLNNFVTQFDNNYKKTNETGYLGGKLPPVSSAAQQADNASRNMGILYAKAQFGGRITNYEAQQSQLLKPSRGMNQDAEQNLVNFWQQKALRIQEENNFATAARNQGVPAQTAQALWNMYQNQRPVYNFSTNTPNTQFQKTWNDYLTPQAIQAAQSGQNYVAIPKFDSKSDYISWLHTIPSADQQYVLSKVAPQSRGGG